MMVVECKVSITTLHLGSTSPHARVCVPDRNAHEMYAHVFTKEGATTLDSKGPS